jgi:phage terminase large subunit
MTSNSEAVYKVYGTAREIFKTRQDEVLYAGPAGTGKSFACILKAHLFCLKHPGVRVLFVRKTLTSLTNTGVDTYKKHIAKHVLENGDVSWYGGSPSDSPAFKYSNGSVIMLGGMDNPVKIMSGEFDMIYVQESTELAEDDWEALTTRLRNGKAPYQQLLADCNPQTPTHWLKRRCDNGLTQMIPSRHEDNPTLFDPETGEITDSGANYMRKLDNLTGVRYLRLRKGIWAAAEGLVYEGFDPTVHVLDQFEIPSDWTRYWSIDFGFNNPFVCQMWAEDPDGRLYLYKEYYWSRRIVEDHAKFIMARLGSDPRPRIIVADHDAEGRATWERHSGLRATPAKKELVEGIQTTESRFVVQPDGKPRIFFLRDAVVERDPILKEAGKPQSTLEEITSYCWEENGPRVVGKPEKENPVKENDHGMDAMRYMVMERDRSSLPRLRFMR